MNRDLSQFFRQIQRDERGSAILLTALALFTMVVATGAAIDLSRNHTLQTNIGTALDAATLAAANASINVPCEIDANNQDELQAWVTSQGVKYFNMNMPQQYLNSTDSSKNTLSFTLDTTKDYKNTSVTGYSSMKINSSVMQIVGDNSIPVNTCSQVHIPLAADLGPDAGHPSPHTQGDLTTGLFSPTPTSGEVAISTQGVERLKVDSAGNLSIGTAFSTNNDTSASALKLEMNGDIISDSGHFTTKNPDGGLVLNGGSTGGSPGIWFRADKVLGNRGITGATDWKELMYIRPDGNVGIGNVNPFAALDVTNAGGNTLPTILIDGTSNNLSSPRLGMVDTQLGAVNTAPVWFVDNNIDFFRIFRQPNIATPGMGVALIANMSTDSTGANTYFNVGVGGGSGVAGASNAGGPQGTWKPMGTLDIERPQGNATLCLNGSCTTTLPGAWTNVSISNTNNYNTGCIYRITAQPDAIGSGQGGAVYTAGVYFATFVNSGVITINAVNNYYNPTGGSNGSVVPTQVLGMVPSNDKSHVYVSQNSPVGTGSDSQQSYNHYTFLTAMDVTSIQEQCGSASTN